MEVLFSLGSQAWEWATFIKGDYGAVETKGGQIVQFVDKEGERVALRDFAAIQQLKELSKHEENGIWFKSESEH